MSVKEDNAILAIYFTVAGVEIGLQACFNRNLCPLHSLDHELDFPGGIKCFYTSNKIPYSGKVWQI